MRMPSFGPALCVLALLGAASPAAAGSYGAVAVGSGEVGLGYSFNYADENGARERALSECRKHAKTCEVKSVLSDVCASIAWTKDGHSGWAWGNGRAKDEQLAMQECAKSAPTGCALAVRFCTGDP